jgi:hypothetical protein
MRAIGKRENQQRTFVAWWMHLHLHLPSLKPRKLKTENFIYKIAKNYNLHTVVGYT